MTRVPVTIMGGLPVIADVWFSGPDYYGEYDCGVDCLYWRKSDGTAGKELPVRVLERLEKHDSFWEADITEQASDWLGCHVPTRYSDGRIEGSYSPEYLKLNPPRAASVDTHPQGRDATQIAAPAPLSGAVPAEEQADAQPLGSSEDSHA